MSCSLTLVNFVIIKILLQSSFKSTAVALETDKVAGLVSWILLSFVSQNNYPVTKTGIFQTLSIWWAPCSLSYKSKGFTLVKLPTFRSYRASVCQERFQDISGRQSRTLNFFVNFFCLTLFFVNRAVNISRSSDNVWLFLVRVGRKRNCGRARCLIKSILDKRLSLRARADILLSIVPRAASENVKLCYLMVKTQ